MKEKNIKIYIAGPLFTEADRKQRLVEEKMLRKKLPKAEIFNPLTAVDVNKKAKVKKGSQEDIDGNDISQVIYSNDAGFIRKANVFFFDVATEDSGTMQEYGMAIELARHNSNILIFVINSDFRLDREASGGEGGFKMNNFVVGSVLVEPNVYGIFRSFKLALQQFLLLLKKK